MLNLRDEKGMTFIEFVVVVLILIVLAGIVGAKYISLALEAERSKCKQNQSSLNGAAALIWADNALVGSPSPRSWRAWRISRVAKIAN